jgi:Transcription factor WhiB
MPRSAYGLEAVRDEDWRTRAACTPDVAELFWPTYMYRQPTRLTSDTKVALRICHTCPVERLCYQDAVDHPEPYPRVAGGRLWMGRKASDG